LSAQRFDELTKTLADGTASRRKFLAGLGTVAAAVLVGPRGAAAVGVPPGGSDCANQGQSCTAQKCCQGFDCLVDLTSSTEKFCCSPNSTLVCGRSCCPTGALGNCSGGNCVCPAGQIVCPDANNPLAGKCVDVSTDADNCGECGIVCAGPIGTDPDAPCRIRACVAGTCTTVPNPAATVCETGNKCTADFCDNGVCKQGPVDVICPDEQCQTCVPSTGLCRPVADGTGCTDGNPCTLNDTCQAGFCTSGLLKDCDDNNECTTDACNPATGNCVHTPLTGTPCETGNKCTTGMCQNGTCTGTQTVTCPQCQVCDTGTGTCKAVENGTLCSDGDVCTLGDTCQGGTCQPGDVKVCGQCQTCADVGGVATCVPDTSKNGMPCSDNNQCTTGETCQNGVCQGGTVTTCPQCQICNPATGACVANPAATGSACNDNNPCTTGETCLNGVCQGGVPVSPGTTCGTNRVCCAGGVCCPGNQVCCGGITCCMSNRCSGGVCR
jgi:hypothetical protein